MQITIFLIGHVPRVADAQYFSAALLNIPCDTLPTIPIAKSIQDLPYLYNYMNIDLTAPNDIIIKSVMANVAYARQMLGIEAVVKRFTGDEFNSWRQHLLLPYLDLLIWNRASALKLTNDDAIEILFGIDDNRKFDKTRKLAKQFFGAEINEYTDNLRALSAQGVQELRRESLGE